MACGSRFGVARQCARVVLLMCLAASAADGATIDVPAGADLQTALNNAQSGDVILLEPGATYIGNFRLPVKSGSTFVTVRTNALPGTLPGPGTRVTPDHAASLAKLKSPNGFPVLVTDPAAHHWRLELLEFLNTTNGNGDIIALGGGASQTQESQMPRDIVIDRVYIHADPFVGQKRGIALNSGYTEIINSYISEIKSVNQEAQAICGWNGTGPYLIENNYLEAAGENILFGGADPGIWQLVPSDITVRRNVMTKPLSWRTDKWAVKNVFELKNARRVLIEGNIIENIWRAGQNGFAVLLTPRNQGGKAPWSVVEDVTFRYNIVRHANGAFNITGFDDVNPSAQTARVQIVNNVFYDLDTAWGGSGTFLQIGSGPRDLVVERNTVVHSGTGVSVYGSRGGAPWPVEGFVFRDNVLRHNTYGIKGDGQANGQGTLNAYFAGLIIENNVFAGGPAAQYPGGNHFPPLADFDVAFVNASGGDFTLTGATALRVSAAGGGTVGADMAKVNASIRGLPLPNGNGGRTGEAVCRPGVPCVPGAPPRSRQR